MVMQKRLKEHMLKICDDRELKVCLNLSDYASASDVVRKHIDKLDVFETPLAMAEELDQILRDWDEEAFKVFFKRVKELYFLYLCDDVLDFYDMFGDEEAREFAKDNVDKHFAVLKELWSYDSYDDVDLDEVFFSLLENYYGEVAKGSVVELIQLGLGNFLELVDEESGMLMVENMIVFFAFTPRDILLPIRNGCVTAIIERLKILMKLRDEYNLGDRRERKREE